MIFSSSKGARTYVQLVGKNQRTIEYDAVVSTGSDLCVMPKVDAYSLGFAEVVESFPSVRSPLSRTVFTMAGLVNSPVIKVPEVKVFGRLVRDVEFAAYDIPQTGGVDVVLGNSLLNRLGATIRCSVLGDLRVD